MRSFFVLAAICLFVSQVVGQDRPCVTYSRDCAGCKTAAAGCGWCADPVDGVGSCMDATEQATCTTDGKAWNDCTLGSGCYANYDNCDDCKADTDCGWCTATSGPTSSFFGACLPAANKTTCDTKWNQCNESTCLFVYSGDCNGCKGNANCGWCGDDNTGLGVCYEIATGSDTCSSGDIGTWNATCVKGLDCVNDYADDCDGCVADPECGWCSISGVGSCVPASAEQTCTNQANSEWGVCSAGSSCTIRHAQDCAACGADNACGWCGLPGNQGGICIDNGNGQGLNLCDAQSGFWRADCPMSCPFKFPDQGDCLACQADPTCGWCSAAGQAGVCSPVAGKTLCKGTWNDPTTCEAANSAGSRLSPFSFF